MFSIKNNHGAYILNEDGAKVFRAPTSCTISGRLDMTLKSAESGFEYFSMQQTVMSRTQTVYIWDPATDIVLLTIRRKMVSMSNTTNIYSGKASFDLTNDTSAEKTFTLSGFNFTSGKPYGGKFKDCATGETCERTRKSLLAIRGTYNLVVEPGYDATLFTAMMLAVARMNDQKKKKSSGGKGAVAMGRGGQNSKGATLFAQKMYVT